MTESQPGHGAEVINLRAFPSPQEVIAAFWQEYEGVLREEIQTAEFRGRIDAQLRSGVSDSNFDYHFFEHERAFVDHILHRLVAILNEAQVAPEELTFTINTSMLYDVDHTLYDQFMGMRPVVKYLLGFLKNLGLRLGIASTRPQGYLQSQMAHPDIAFSLTEIAEFIDGEVIGIYAPQTEFSAERNTANFDPFFYPELQPEQDLQYVLQKIGFTQQEAAGFEANEFADFIELKIHEEALALPWLHFDCKIEDEIRRLSWSENILFNKDEAEELTARLIPEVALRTFEIADTIDNEPLEGQNLHFQRMISSILEGGLKGLKFSVNQVDSLRIIVEAALLASWKYIHKVSSPLGRRQALMDEARKQVNESAERNLRDFLSLATCGAGDPDNAIYRFRRRILIQEDGPRMSKVEFQESLTHAFFNIKKANEEHVFSTDKKIADLLSDGIYPREVQIALQRLAAARRQLENGQAIVSIAVDNRQVAEALDQLLQGNITDPQADEKIDGYTLLGLEKYRGRLYLIHVGKNAEYSVYALRERINVVAA